MKWSPSLYFLGTFLVVFGLVLLLISNGGTESGFFFIFPFFFFGNVQSFSVVLLIGSAMVVFLVMIYIMSNLVTRADSDIHQHSEFMTVASYCKYCQSPIPVDATYCPNCGHPVDYDSQDGEEF